MEDPKAKLQHTDYEEVVKQAREIEQYPIYYVDSPGTVDDIRNTILHFMEKFPKKWLIVMLDHTLLIKGNQGERERETLFELQRMFMEMKKLGSNTIIQLSQLNRNIESSERITSPSLHFPMRSDIFGGDSIFQTSDYVMVIHRPEILGIINYGTSNWPVKNLIYLHILKNREGEPKILVFENNLKYNSIEEFNKLSSL